MLVMNTHVDALGMDLKHPEYRCNMIPIMADKVTPTTPANAPIPPR